VYYLHEVHTGIGQNNGNTTDTVHISLLIWCWTTILLEGTFSSCFRDVGGGTKSCSDLVIVLVREDAEVHLHALQTMTEQFQLLLFRNNV
jgi:hypothetical protein